MGCEMERTFNSRMNFLLELFSHHEPRFWALAVCDTILSAVITSPSYSTKWVWILSTVRYTKEGTLRWATDCEQLRDHVEHAITQVIWINSSTLPLRIIAGLLKKSQAQARWSRFSTTNNTFHSMTSEQASIRMSTNEAKTDICQIPWT